MSWNLLHPASAEFAEAQGSDDTAGAQAWRNARADSQRAVRWQSVRDHAWALLDNAIQPDATVAVVGAGNADDLPLTRLAARASRVDLVDIDLDAVTWAIRREPRALRRKLRKVSQDVTGGAADRILTAAKLGIDPPRSLAPTAPIGTDPYDVVVADLFYTQLLYPALLDAELDKQHRSAVLERCGQPLTDSVVARLHRSARTGLVIHLHDVAGWWIGNPQPVTLDDVLSAGPSNLPSCALVRAQGCDPEVSLRGVGIPVLDRHIWRWPFASGVDYLVVGIVARGTPRYSARQFDDKQTN